MKKLFTLAVVAVCAIAAWAAKPDPNQLRYDSLMMSNAQLAEQVTALAGALQTIQEQNIELQKQLIEATRLLTEASGRQNESLARMAVSADSLAAAASRLAIKPEAAEAPKGEYKVMTVKNGDKIQVPEGKHWKVVSYWSEVKYDRYALKKSSSVVMDTPAIKFTTTISGKTIDLYYLDGIADGIFNAGYVVDVEVYREFYLDGTNENAIRHEASDTFHVLYYEY